MFLSFLQSAIRFSTIFLFGSTGETLTEKSGNLNLGIPGIMCVGAVGGCLGEQFYLASLNDISEINGFCAVIIPILMAMLFAGLMGLLYCFLTVTLRCNQNVTGLAITTFGAGFLSYYKSRIDSTNFNVASHYFTKLFPTLEGASTTGTNVYNLFFGYGILVYLAIIISVIVAVILKKTRIGLHLRAVGESPATADATGINVSSYKYAATIIGAAIAGLGGLFYIMDWIYGSIEASVEAFGWMAVALVIFSVWKPNWGILGSILFGALYIAPSYIISSFATKEIVKMIPYLVTLVVLIITSVINKRETQPPMALGLSYFREER